MSEHTLGPWRHRPYMHDKKYRVVYFSTKRDEPYGTSPLEPADARLIAAAPDLLEVCKASMAHVQELREAWRTGALSECDGRGGERSNRNVDVEVALRAAIAKAEGAGQ